MKIFAVYALVTFPDKPSWLEQFRSRYDLPYPLHMTLKQHCFIANEETGDVKNILARILAGADATNMQIGIEFRRLLVDDKLYGHGCIMIGADDNPQLNLLRQSIVTALGSYRSYLKPQGQEYERDFKPHITIGRRLSPEQLKQALTELPSDISLAGVIEKIVLSIIDEVNPAQVNDPKNQTIYGLKAAKPV
jgi:2'-5' RNA ligase